MGKRRGRGEGAIFQRSNGTWAAEVPCGQDALGRRKRKTVYGKTKRDVQEKMHQVMADAQAGLLPDTKGKSVGVFLKEWLDTVVRPMLRPNTYISYEVIVRVHIIPRIGHLQLSKLTPAHVQALYGDMEKAGISPRLRQLAHSLLHRALDQAVRWGMLPRNVTKAVVRPRAPKKNFRAFTPDEARTFLDAAKADRLYALYVLAIATGMRQGELLALQWDDVDLKSGFLSVRHTLLDLKGKLELGETKTVKSRRHIKLPEMARTALLGHKERMFAEGHAKGFVFPDTTGGPINKSNMLTRSFKPLLISAGLPKIRFHDLRHTAATLMLLAGVHPKVVQEILGHSQISVTLDTYSHVLPSMQVAAAETMDGLLKGSAV